MALQGILEHAHDPGGTFVLRSLELEALHHGVVGRRADQRHRARVGDVGEQRTERERHAHLESIGDSDELLAEEPPAEGGLGSEHEQHVGTGQRDRPDAHGGPHDRSVMILVEAHLRADRGEIGEHVGIDLGERRGSPRLDHGAERGGGGVTGVVPAGERAQQDRARRAWARRSSEHARFPHRSRYRSARCSVSAP